MINPSLALEIVRDDPSPIAYDVETTGLAITDKIVGYVITNDSHSLYVPTDHTGGGNIPSPLDFEKCLSDAFKIRSRRGYRTIGHNLGFDLRFSLRRGVVIESPCEDTMINELLIDDTVGKWSLDEAAKRRGVTPKLGDALYRELAHRFGGLPDRSSMKHFHLIEGDHPLAVEYAVGDGVTTLELWEAQQPLLDEMVGPEGNQSNLRKAWKLECDLIPYVARMHHRGMRIDMENAPRLKGLVAAQIAEAKSKFEPGFNVRSPAAVEGLFRLNGFVDDDFARTAPTSRHPKGQISFREKWLELNEIGRSILSVRRLEKLVDSFMTPLIETHNIAGRVHPVLNQSKSDDYGVAGARFSCSDPNLQAFPKRNKQIGKLVRPLVIPDDGMVIEEADAKQQEPRLFTHFSEEPELVKGYSTGTVDIHDLAGKYLNITVRDTAKRMAMGMLTMMSPKTLAMHMGWEGRDGLAHAKDMHAKFLTDAFPMIGDFQRTAMVMFKRRGYVRSILQRRANCVDPRFAYVAVSRIIQNSGGDHMKTCLLRACQYEDAHPGAIQLLLTIHDSLMWQRDPAHPNDELIRILENVPHEPDFSLLVPIPFEVGSGRNWSEASYGK